MTEQQREEILSAIKEIDAIAARNAGYFPVDAPGQPEIHELCGKVEVVLAPRSNAEVKAQPVAFQFGPGFRSVANHWPPQNPGDLSIRPLYIHPTPQVPEEWQAKVLELCSAVENEDDLPPVKYALKCGRLINEVKDMVAAATAPAGKPTWTGIDWAAGTGKAERFPYQKTFNAIAAATASAGAPVVISVQAFRDAFDAPDPGERQPAERPDPLYDEAVSWVRREGRATITFLQRKLKVGYNRGVRLMEFMEANGVVSAPDNIGRRTVLQREPES